MMIDKIYMDDNFIKDIDYYSYSIKNSITIALREADKVKTVTDINYVKTLIDKLIPQEISPENKAILLLFILNEYSRNNYRVETVSIEVKGFFTSLCLTFLHDLDFRLVYKNKMLIELFNEVLIKYLKNCNELETSRILESFHRFKQSVNNKKLYFFQVHVIKQLFDHKMYSNILEFIEEYNIDDFDHISDKNFILDSLFSYFHCLSYTLIISKKYQKAYQLIQVMMNLNLLVDINKFQHVLTEFIFVSLMTNKGIEDTDIIILKYKNKIFPRLLKIYQSYQTFDLESFVCNYHLYINQLHDNNQEQLYQLFSYDSLTLLCHQLIDNKLDVYVGKFSNDLLLEKVSEINMLINEINLKFVNYDYQLAEYKFNRSTKNQGMNYTTLLDDCERLKIAGHKSKVIYAQLNS